MSMQPAQRCGLTAPEAFIPAVADRPASIVLDLPEVVVKMSMPVLQGKLMTDVDWMMNGNSVARYFTGATKLDAADSLLAYSKPQLPAVPTNMAGASGPAEPERLLRFPAVQVAVPATPGVHAMRLVWLVKGCKPVDSKTLGSLNKSLPSGQSQPVIFAELSLHQLYAGRPGRMRVGCIPMATGEPAYFEDLFDILHTGVPTEAPENDSAKAVLEVGVRHTPQSLASRDAALALHAKFHVPSSSISLELSEHSKLRQEQTRELLSGFTDKATVEQCGMSMVTLTTGSEASNSKKVDWAQWSESIDTHNTLTLDMLVPELVNACLEVGTELASGQKLGGAAGMLQAVQKTDNNVLTTKLHQEVNLQVAAAAHYAFDTKLDFDMSAVTSSDRLKVFPRISPCGENQNPGGYHSLCSLAVNSKTLAPQKQSIDLELGTLLQNAAPPPGPGAPAAAPPASGPDYDQLTPQVKALILDSSRVAQAMTSCEDDCEDLATKNMLIFNAVFPLAAEHHEALAAGRPSRLSRLLGEYADVHPELTAHMPAVQHTILNTAQTGRRLDAALILASGAKLDQASAGSEVPLAVAGPNGVFEKLKAGMQQGALAGHCVAAEAVMGALDPAHPAHLALAAMQAQGKCAHFSLSANTSTTYYEGTGAARQVVDSLADTVKLSFVPVPDNNLQQKLDMIAATPLPAFKATNLITALQSQAMTRNGLSSSIVQKFSLADTRGFYQYTLAIRSGAALTTDGVAVAPTGYIPTVHDSKFTRMHVNTPCSAREQTLIRMLYTARQALNPSMHDLEATAVLAGVSRPPMAFRGLQLLQTQTGERSSIVIKTPCHWTAAAKTDWVAENAARCLVARKRGFASFRNISSEIWIADFCTNPSQP